VFGWRQRLYNYKDTKAFVSVPLREGQQSDSVAFSVSFFVCCFLGLVIFVKIPEFLVIEISIESEKYYTNLGSKHF
jgi:hypothetical protein